MQIQIDKTKFEELLNQLTATAEELQLSCRGNGNRTNAERCEEILKAVADLRAATKPAPQGPNHRNQDKTRFKRRRKT